MYAIDDQIGRQETVTLHVRDPARSQDFYQDLFGLIMREQAGPRTQRVLETPGTTDHVSVVLRTRVDASDGPVWLSVEVGSVSEVLDLYLLAIMMGAKAVLPRKRGDRWSTVLNDPDGNRICVWTRVDESDDSVPGALRPQRWEWRMAAPPGQVLEDDLDRRMARATQTPPGGAGVPGRTAIGADRPDRRHGRAGSGGGGTPYHTPGRDKTLEGKE